MLQGRAFEYPGLRRTCDWHTRTKSLRYPAGYGQPGRLIEISLSVSQSIRITLAPERSSKLPGRRDEIAGLVTTGGSVGIRDCRVEITGRSVGIADRRIAILSRGVGSLGGSAGILGQGDGIIGRGIGIPIPIAICSIGVPGRRAGIPGECVELPGGTVNILGQIVDINGQLPDP
jgi:hypothetical protein